VIGHVDANSEDVQYDIIMGSAGKIEGKLKQSVEDHIRLLETKP